MHIERMRNTMILPAAQPLYPESGGFKFLKTKRGVNGLLCDFHFDPTLYRVVIRHGSDAHEYVSADMENAHMMGGDFADCAAMVRARVIS